MAPDFPKLPTSYLSPSMVASRAGYELFSGELCPYPYVTLLPMHATFIFPSSANVIMTVSNAVIANVSSRFMLLFFRGHLKDTTKKRKCERIEEVVLIYALEIFIELFYIVFSFFDGA